MKIYVINGSNLNMLGVREPEIYGKEDYNSLVDAVTKHAKEKNIEVVIYQSNHEGCLVDKIQEAYFEGADGIVINPGAYTHTSIAILDALKAVSIRTVEVHISDVSAREDFRQISYVSLVAEKRIIGKGIQGYIEAIDTLIEGYTNKNEK